MEKLTKDHNHIELSKYFTTKLWNLKIQKLPLPWGDISLGSGLYFKCWLYVFVCIASYQMWPHMTIPNNLQGHIEKKISYRHLELDLIVDGLRVRAQCHSPGLVGPYLTVFEQKTWPTFFYGTITILFYRNTNQLILH